MLPARYDDDDDMSRRYAEREKMLTKDIMKMKVLLL